MSEWISVDERMPEKNKPVLTYGVLPGSHGYYEDEWCFSVSTRMLDGWSSQRSLAFGNTFRPTHWMPLPALPVSK